MLRHLDGTELFDEGGWWGGICWYIGKKLKRGVVPMFGIFHAGY